MQITNKTRRPLRVPLPDGKTLFLGPLKTGQITPKAGKHAPLLALVEAGDLELDDSARRTTDGDSKGSPGIGPGRTGGSMSNIRRTGDR